MGPTGRCSPFLSEDEVSLGSQRSRSPDKGQLSPRPTQTTLVTNTGGWAVVLEGWALRLPCLDRPLVSFPAALRRQGPLNEPGEGPVGLPTTS